MDWVTTTMWLSTSICNLIDVLCRIVQIGYHTLPMNIRKTTQTYQDIHTTSMLFPHFSVHWFSNRSYFETSLHEHEIYKLLQQQGHTSRQILLGQVNCASCVQLLPLSTSSGSIGNIWSIVLLPPLREAAVLSIASLLHLNKTNELETLGVFSNNLRTRGF